MRNAISVDVEDWFHPEILQGQFCQDDWKNLEPRVVQNTQRLLRLLDDAKVKGTFFILGWVAENHPELVTQIASEGHEIASHGYAHQMITRQSQEEFSEDLSLSLEILRSLSKQKVVGYRAPSFSVIQETLWAFDIMIENGIEYDSSIYPVHHDRYGIPEAPRSPYRVARKGEKELWELPPPTFRVLGRNLPSAGGGYLRLLPTWIARMCIQQLNSKDLPAVVYTHPWEFDPDQPRVEMSKMKQFRHYTNIGTCERKLECLLRSFEFGTCNELVEAIKEARVCEMALA